MRPDPVAPIGGHYVPGDIAAAIVCRTQGVYEYFNVTDMYLQHLGVMGADSIEAAAERLNNSAHPVRECFDRALDRASLGESWVDEAYSVGGSSCKLHMRLIASYEEGDAQALLVIVRETVRDRDR